MVKYAEKRPIRENSYKLLLWLHEAKCLRKEDLELVWTGMTKESRRSLLNYLIKKEWVVMGRNGQKEVIMSTWTGREIIEWECPLLPQTQEKWDGNWIEVMLNNGGGENEQSLWMNWRRKLKKCGAKQIVKGVYIMPSIIAERFLDIRDLNGVKGVMMMKVYGENMGNVLDTIRKREKEYEIVTMYSGISRQVDRLLKTKNIKKEAIHRNNINIFNLFFQLLFLVKEDRSFGQWFKSQQGREESDFVRLLKQLSYFYGKSNELFWD